MVRHVLTGRVPRCAPVSSALLYCVLCSGPPWLRAHAHVSIDNTYGVGTVEYSHIHMRQTIVCT